MCISGAVVSQCPSRPATVISSTAFDFDIVFAVITAIFLAVVDQSNSCTLTGRFGSIAVVSYDFVLCNTWRLSNSQGKVATLLVVSRHLLAISYKKLQFVKVMSKVLSVPYSRTRCRPAARPKLVSEKRIRATFCICYLAFSSSICESREQTLDAECNVSFGALRHVSRLNPLFDASPAPIKQTTWTVVSMSTPLQP